MIRGIMTGVSIFFEHYRQMPKIPLQLIFQRLVHPLYNGKFIQVTASLQHLIPFRL